MTFYPDPAVDALMAVWAAQLTVARQEAGMSQRALALVLGTTQGSVSNMEGLRWRPDVTTWTHWAAVFDHELILIKKEKR